MLPTPSFPAAVWSGTAGNRTNPSTDHQSPSAEDQERVIAELQAIQSDLRTYTPITIRLTTPNTAGDTDLVVPYAIKVIDVVAMKIVANGGASDAVTVKNGATAITDVMSLNINDKLLARALSIDDASQDIAAGGTLRVTTGKTTNCQAIVTVYALKG